jgi:hypothetical protein
MTISGVRTALVLAWLLACSTVSWAGPTVARRVTLARHKGTFRVVRVSTVVKTLPPSDDLLDDAAASLPRRGFWYEVQAESGRVVYRRIVRAPDGPLCDGAALAAAPTDAALAVLVPACRGRCDLVVFGEPSPAAAPSARALTPSGAVELARFALEPSPAASDPR